jgi:hypothetical protein
MTHNPLKRSTDLPLIYANDSKDTTTGQRLIKQVEISAGLAPWDDKRKGQQLASILLGKAQSWWDSLERSRLTRNTGPPWRHSVLKNFDAKHSVKLIFANLQDLTQKQGYSILHYFSKNIKTFKRLMSAKTDDMPQNMAAINDLKSDCWIAIDWSITHYFQT